MFRWSTISRGVQNVWPDGENPFNVAVENWSLCTAPGSLTCCVRHRNMELSCRYVENKAKIHRAKQADGLDKCRRCSPSVSIRNNASFFAWRNLHTYAF